MGEINLEEFATLLAQMRDPQNEVRNAAELQYKRGKTQPDVLIKGLVQVLGQHPDATQRDHAAVLLKNCCKPDLADQGRVLLDECSGELRKMCLDGLLERYEHESDEKVRMGIGIIFIYAIRNIEVSKLTNGQVKEGGYWMDLLAVIVRMCRDPDEKKRITALSHLSGTDDTNGLVVYYKDVLKKQQADLQTLLEENFGHQSPNIRASAAILVLKIVQEWNSKDWKALQPTLIVILKVIESLASNRQNETLTKVLTIMSGKEEDDDDDCVTVEKLQQLKNVFNFVKPNLTELAQLLSQIAQARDELADEPRNMALIVFVRLAGVKPKQCHKLCPLFGSLLLKACMECMMEVSDDIESWAEVEDDDEDNDEDTDLNQSAGTCIDQLIYHYSIKTIGKTFADAIAAYACSDNWKSQYAAITAISWGQEYVEDATQVDNLMTFCIQRTQHEHVRVRAASWTALSHIIDDHKDVCDRFPEAYMRATFASLQDQFPRLQKKCLSTFAWFGESVDRVILEPFVEGLMTTLTEMTVRPGQQRGVLEECITAIAVISSQIGWRFAKYYDQIMPQLKNLIANSTEEKETKLRGKALECMSLFGVAVGRKKFSQDCAECIGAMLQVDSGSKNSAQKNLETISDYIKQAIERIATVMKEDFAPFLEPLLQLYLAPLDTQKNIGVDGHKIDEEEDDYLELVDGRKVKEEYFRDMANSLETIKSMATDTRSAFIPHVQTVGPVLLKLMSEQDMNLVRKMERQFGVDHERRTSVLDEAGECWAAIVRTFAKTDAGKCKEMIETFLKTNIKYLNKSPFTWDAKFDERIAEAVAVGAKGIANVLKYACPDNGLPAARKAEFQDHTQYVSKEDLMNLAQMAMVLVNDFMVQRCKELQDEANDKEEEEEQEADEDEDVEVEDPIQDAIYQLVFLLTALMQINPPAALQMLPDTEALLRKLLDTNSDWVQQCPEKDRKEIILKNKKLAYDLAHGVCEHLGDQGVAIWPIFLEAIFGDIKSQEFELRNSAHYWVFIVAGTQAFGQYAPKAVEFIVDVINNPENYGKSEQKHYVSNADLEEGQDLTTAALFQVLANRPELATAQPKLWDIVFDRLPLKTDVEVMGPVCTYRLIDLLTQQRADVMGANNVNMGKICGILCDTFRFYMDEDCDRMIQSVLKQIPENVLMQVKEGFKATQWKKLEDVMTEDLS